MGYQRGRPIFTGEFGRYQEVVLDGDPVVLFECPTCHEWGELDDDQMEGRVSVQHDCGYHETHYFFGDYTNAAAKP